jgi:hypothetical protein
MMLYGKYSLERHEDALMGWNGNDSSARLIDLNDQRVIGNTDTPRRTPGAADATGYFAAPQRRRALASGSPSSIDI